MDIEKIKKTALDELEKVKDLAGLEIAKVKHLGRSSDISGFLRAMKDKTEDERRELGKIANSLRGELEERFVQQKVKLNKLTNETLGRLDITRPAPKLPKGHIHPLTQVQEIVGRVFSSMGFEVLEGPEIETEFNNFDALNIPEDHPARDMQDTFWVHSRKKRLLMRTHTSPMQIRYMQIYNPPFRIVVPGRVFRHEATDATHEFQFHQVEGLVVGNDISMANLKGVMEYFFKQFFKDDVKVKFVASYFPFTEPSVEVYIRGTKGKLKDKWIEVAGAGMVHQNVFKAAGYVPGRWQGFAFGMAVERIAMLKYKIDDIRLFHGSDLRFLKQF
jgi:phenylalanyl-tRNA synthetase alpha chain